MSSRIVRSQRDWLLERLIVEAGDYATADAQIRQMRLGRVDGYLGVGVAIRILVTPFTDIMYDTILHGQAWPARLRRMAR
jgi:hypothetical protein